MTNEKIIIIVDREKEGDKDDDGERFVEVKEEEK